MVKIFFAFNKQKVFQKVRYIYRISSQSTEIFYNGKALPAYSLYSITKVTGCNKYPCARAPMWQETEEYPASDVAYDGLLAQIIAVLKFQKTNLTPRRLFLHKGNEIQQKKTLPCFLSKNHFDNFGLHTEIDNAELRQPGKKIIKTCTIMICCLHCYFQNNTELLFYGK